MHIKIFTDGSSLGNPGPGGFCAIVKKGSASFIVKGKSPHTTNNRMELSAVIAGLFYVHKHFPNEKNCNIYSDSSLIVETMNKGWKRKKNLDLWKKLDVISKHFNEISWNWIRGHSGHAENTMADKIAVAQATKSQRLLQS